LDDNPEGYRLKRVNITFSKDSATDIMAALEEGFKFIPLGLSGQFLRTIDRNVSINMILLFNDHVQIDFNADPIPESYSETQKLAVLEAITKTLHEYYNVDMVYVTVDGRQYNQTIFLKDAQWGRGR